MSRKPVKGEYIETDTGNKVARKAILIGTQHIMLGGKTVIQAEAMIRGDLYRTAQSSSSAAKGAVCDPPAGCTKGDQVFIGEGSVVQAATIGSHVHIGSHVVIGEFAIIKDYVRILDGTIVPANMVIPSFSIVGGQPARVIGEVPEGGHEAFELRELYKTVGNNPQPLPV
ncbi:hypothetical protein DL764_008659 [Monosporascus ibericus]|uniref:Dynactin subunit 5 n=1 Tax=Monosporascus ibericus TaxID=155417 RepID=A0A4Q4SZX5_9PEZI|nr:hypothetical protein DL764_008659 [Monosporascus ibericus]